MKVETASQLPKEGENNLDRDLFIKKRDAFQVSEHYEFVMSVIDECLAKSAVKELLSKNPSPNEAEVGRLTLVDWLAEKKINTEIKERLSYGR